MNIPEEAILEFVSLLVCLLISAISSGSETVVTSITHLRAKQLLEEYPSIYKKPLEIWMHAPSRIITAILILNNVVNIVISVLITSICLKLFSSYALSAATGIATVIILFFGEIIPKSFGKNFSISCSKPCLLFVYAIYKIEYPLVFVFAGIADFFVSKHKNQEAKSITEKDLEFMIDEGEASGVIESMKKEMLSSVFEFDEIVVREIMRPRTDVVALEKHASIDEALSLAISTGYSRIPVYDDQIDHIIGIIYSKDLLKYVYGKKHGSSSDDKDLSSLEVSSVMRIPLFVPESKLIMEVFKDLKRYKNHMAIVIDEYGGTAGLVTLEDILEEIVGEIQDEFDKEESDIVQISKNSYMVSGTLNVDDFLEYFKLEEQDFIQEKEQEVDTMSGFLISVSGDLPKVGVTIAYPPFIFTIMEVVQYRIKKFRVDYHPVTTVCSEASSSVSDSSLESKKDQESDDNHESSKKVN